MSQIKCLTLGLRDNHQTVLPTWNVGSGVGKGITRQPSDAAVAASVWLERYAKKYGDKLPVVFWRVDGNCF